MASITTFFGSQGGGGISGSGAEGEVAYFDSATSVDSNSALYWDTSGSSLVIGALAPAPGVAVARIQAYGISDPGSSLLALYAGNVWGNIPIMRLSEKGTLYLSSNAGVSGLTENVFIGDSAIGQNATITATGNIAIGHPASGGGLPPGGSLTTGDSNILIGGGAGRSINSGSGNIAIGLSSGRSITSGEYNLSAGINSASALTTGSSNSFLGYNSGGDATTGDNNTALGVSSLAGVVSTGGNTAIGVRAGSWRGATGSTLNTNCTQCVYVGSFTRSIAAGAATNEIVIGHDAVGHGSNSVTLGHTTVTNTYLRGDINLVEGGDLVLGTTTGTKIGTATTEKLAFYGDTPIVQPSTSIASAPALHGSGAAVKEDSTFGGYTIGQIVTALQTLGLLA
jgi:hypothetical protein